MAERIKLSVEADKKAIYVYDNTGCYDSKCNPGGWGTPNLKQSDIEEATVEVFPPESESGIIIDVIDILNEDGIGLEILAEELGLKEIPSGRWQFIYRVKSDANSFEQAFAISKYFDEVIACCVSSMTVNADVSDFTTEGNKRFEMELLLDNARWAACQGDLTTAQTLANHLSLQCKCCK